MALTTRKPTGKAAFPIILLAGEAGSGKTWASVEASAMEEVHRTFFIEIGEGQADEYGAVPGADFEIVDTDGTLGSLRGALAAAAEEPAPEGKYNLLIVDSMTELWSLITGEAQVAANRRGRGRKNQDGDRQITMDLWNRANDTWEGIVRQLKAFPGPVLMTARMKITAVVNEDGQPTGDKDWKIESQKNLPYRATVVVQARQPRVWTMTKIATTVPELQLQPGKETTFQDFSVATLLRKMGVTAETEISHYAAAHADGHLTDEAEANREQQAAQRAQEEQQEETRRQYEAWAAEQQQKLLDFEKSGDMEKLVAMRDWYAAKGYSELTVQAGQIIDRLAKSTAQEVVEAEPLPM